MWGNAVRLLAVLSLGSVQAYAFTYCAFEVKVTKPSGVPFPNIAVGMVDKGTQVATAVTNSAGVSQFCDAPLHAVDIVVGVQACGVVLVQHVTPEWPVTRNVFVIYDETHCSELVLKDRCQVLLRIQDEEGHPLAGTQFDSGRSERDASDVFGRIFRTIKSGEKLEGVLTKEGRRSALISQSCIRGDERDLELKVVLNKR